MRTLIDERRMFARPNLKNAIEAQGRKSSWVAAQVGLSRSQLSHIAAGRRTIGETDARVISALLGQPLNQFFRCSDEHIQDSQREHQGRDVA